MSIRIKDVAKKAGVSTATVSRVINEHPNVADSTRKRVLKIIDEIHYFPNQGGRNLRKQESKTILVLIPDIRNYFYSNILHGMDTITTQNGYNLIIASTHSNRSREKKLINLLHQKLADGIIFLSSTLPESELKELDQNYSIVQCCEYNEDTNITHISIDNYKAAYSSVEYLIQKGHKRIAFLSSNNSFLSTKLRETGYIQALKSHSIEYDEKLIIKGNYSFESGYLATNTLMTSLNPPSAIFTISDVVASGTIQALYQLGKKVPDDVAVFGFDDIDLARQVTPPLSTVAQPLQLLGSMAVKTLVDKIKGIDVPSEIILPYELMIRRSA